MSTIDLVLPVSACWEDTEDLPETEPPGISLTTSRS